MFLSYAATYYMFFFSFAKLWLSSSGLTRFMAFHYLYILIFFTIIAILRNLPILFHQRYARLSAIRRYISAQCFRFIKIWWKTIGSIDLAEQRCCTIIHLDRHVGNHPFTTFSVYKFCISFAFICYRFFFFTFLILFLCIAMFLFFLVGLYIVTSEEGDETDIDEEMETVEKC